MLAAESSARMAAAKAVLAGAVEIGPGPYAPPPLILDVLTAERLP
jgi:hypothetical protein